MRLETVVAIIAVMFLVLALLIAAYSLYRFIQHRTGEQAVAKHTVNAVETAKTAAEDAQTQAQAATVTAEHAERTAEMARATAESAVAAAEHAYRLAEERAAELSILKDLAEVLNQTLPPERALEVGVEQVARQVRASMAWLLTITPDKKAELSTGFQLPPHFELARGGSRRWSLCACLKETLYGDLNTPRPFQCERLARTPGMSENQKQHLSIPVWASGVPVGILNLVFQEPRTFDAAEMRLVSALGNQFGGAVERARLFKEVHQLAVTDSLTGLYNRRSFMTMFTKEIERARRYRHPISLALLDIDHFKQINDTYGHLAGDYVLVKVAQLCQEAMRRIDLVARYGGEEIIFLMPETGKVQALRAIERLRQNVEKMEVPTARGTVRLTISAGVACSTNVESIDLEQLIERADQALYQAKNSGRNKVRMI